MISKNLNTHKVNDADLAPCELGVGLTHARWGVLPAAAVAPPARRPPAGALPCRLRGADVHAAGGLCRALARAAPLQRATLSPRD